MDAPDESISVQDTHEDIIDDRTVDRAEVDRLKSVVGLSSEEERLLESQSPVFEDVAEDLSAEFFDSIRGKRVVLDALDESGIGRPQVERAQRQYLVDFGSGRYDASFFEQRLETEGFQELLGVGPERYLGAYAMYYEGVFEAIGSAVKAEYGAAEEMSSSEPGSEDAGTPETDGGVTAQSLPAKTASVEDAVDAVVERSLAFLRVATIDQVLSVQTSTRAYRERVEQELEEQRKARDNIGSALEELSESADEISNGSQEVSALAREQSGSMSEVAGEISNLSATVEEIASNAEEVSSTSERAKDIADESGEVAEHAITKMERVENASQAVAGDIQNLRESVEKIDEIVEVINKIADQTNLLALNASIEAATAGEAGDGFAVVANEVKSLAEESQEEAANIERMIDRIQEDTDETVESIETANEEVTDGVDLVEETVDNLERIEEAVSESVQGIQEVAIATDDQAASTEEIASMADDVMQQASEVTDRVDDIVTANDRQTGMVQDISATVDQLTEETE